MKKAFLLLMLLTLFLSCNEKGGVGFGKQQEEKEIFKIEKVDESKFKRVGNSFQYVFKGNVENLSENLSENLFEEVHISLEIEFELENGNRITESDYYDGFSMFASMGDVQRSWKSKEIRKIDGLGSGGGISSAYIPEHYLDYPIKKVYSVFIFEAQDLINRKQVGDVIIADVTSQWNPLK